MYSLRSSTMESRPQLSSESGASGSSSWTATSKSGWSAGIQSVPAGNERRSMRRSTLTERVVRP